MKKNYKKKYYKAKFNNNSSSEKNDESEMIELFTGIIFNMIKYLSENVITGDIVDSSKSAIFLLHNYKYLDAAMKAGGICPDCGATMESNSNFSQNIFVMVLMCLIKNGMVTPEKITVPEYSTISEWIGKYGLLTEMDLWCGTCGYKKYAITSTKESTYRERIGNPRQ